MSYEPLHHKYRPQTFAELVGQEAIATTLTNAIRQQKIAPAYLFTGARGTGKTSSARILAKSLNCLSSNVPTEKPCGVCEVCRTIARGMALDVIEIDAASNTGVDNIRDLIERAQFAPVQCRYKVYIIDEVHMLSPAAFNALLKTLEEPPDRVVFVLATTDPQRVLPTIISRCQKFDYRRIPLDAMVKHLRYIADKEAIAITDEAVTLVAQIAQGGLRDAESLLDQLSLSDQVSVEQVWDLVGSVPERDLLDLVQAIAQDDPETVIDRTRRLMERGREPLIVLQNLASFYRDLLIAKTAPDRPDLVALTPSTWQTLCTFAQQLHRSTILAGQQHLRSAEVQLKHTTQPRLWLEVTLMGLLPSALGNQTQPPQTQPKSSAPPAKSAPAVPASPPLSATPSSTSESPVELPPQPVISQPSTQPKPEPNVTPEIAKTETALPKPPDEVEQLWQQILANVELQGTRAMLNVNCHLLRFNRDEINIGIKSANMVKMIQRMLPQLEAACVKTLKAKPKVTLEIDDKPPTKLSNPVGSPSGDRADPSAHQSARSEPAPQAPTAQTGQPPADAAIAASEPFDREAEIADYKFNEALKNLANDFNGTIVTLDACNDVSGSPPATTPPPIEASDPIETSDPMASSEKQPEPDDDDDDVPF